MLLYLILTIPWCDIQERGEAVCEPFICVETTQSARAPEKRTNGLMILFFKEPPANWHIEDPLKIPSYSSSRY